MKQKENFGQDSLGIELYLLFRQELMPIIIKLFQK